MSQAITLSLPQQKVICSRKALTLNMAGQRAGKSFGIGYRSGLYVKYFPHMVGMIAANTYKQLTQSTMLEVRRVWKNVHGYTEYDKFGNPDGVYVVGKKPPAHFTKLSMFDDYRGIVSFRNGAVIFTAALTNYLVHEGKTLGWAELDETKDTEENAVKQVILARLSQPGLYYDEDGTLWFSEDPSKEPASANWTAWTAFNPCVINTSPAEGVVDWLVELFDLKSQEEEINQKIFNPGDFYYHEFGTKAVCIYSTYWNAHNLAKNYIENRLDQLTAGEADKFIFGYPFAKTGDEYYDYFDRRIHVRKVERIPGLPDHLTYDFNLVPYMTLVCFQIHETETELQIRIFKEYCFKQPRNTTAAISEAYRDEHEGEITDVFYYGDAMGKRGVEGFGDEFTRFDPVRTALIKYLYAGSDRTTRRNIGTNKRRDLLNKILAGKQYVGSLKVVLMIDEECLETIRDFQYLKLGPNGKLKEKVKDKASGRTWEKFGHTSDAVEYGICEVFEMLVE
jgi:hypothetical protein